MTSPLPEETTLDLQNPVTPKVITHSECVEAATRYMSKRYDVVLPEFFSHNAELPDVIAFKTRYSVVVECKVSRGDFHADKKKPFRIKPENGMGDYRYYCCPKDLIRKDELPPGWGLLYIYPSGQVREVKGSYFKRPPSPDEWRWGGRFEKNLEAESYLLYYYARRANYAGVHKTIMEYRGTDG